LFKGEKKIIQTKVFCILFIRDALATRLYSVRMMEQFISHRKILYELTEFDENTVKIYTVRFIF
jgi:hypothetical protein